MARTPDEGRSREKTVSVRITAALEREIDAARGTTHTSTWWRQAAIEKLARGGR